jgi:predicted ABC-type ATPase
MTAKIPRLRMFAGPNGSGKSTIKTKIEEALPLLPLGVYINPDEIEKQVKKAKYIDSSDYEISATKEEIEKFFLDSTLISKKPSLKKELKLLGFSDNKISFELVNMNSYFASVCSDFIRNKLLVDKKSFTFETVMSSQDKIEILKKARLLGYRTYLYYVSTGDPLINENRVRNRVAAGGHNVPKEKIKERYKRSMGNLGEAIKFTNRAFIYDNLEEAELIAEITDSSTIEIKTEYIPKWFDDYVLDKFEVIDG